MRIALAQLNPTVGDVAGNARLVLDAMREAEQAEADLFIASEMLLIGYPPRDLLLREGVVEASEQAVRAIAKARRGAMTVLVGHPRRVSGGVRPLANSVSACRGGRIVAVYDKRLLPGYDVFDEDRYFEPGDKPCVIEVAGRRVGLLICEDLWRADDVTAECRYRAEPAAETAALGADLLVSLNASPFVAGKFQRHLDQLQSIATTFRRPIVSVNQVGGNDDLVFDGRSVIVDAMGEVAIALPAWREHVAVVEWDESAGAFVAVSGENRASVDSIRAMTHPMAELWGALTLGVRDYVRKTGHREVIIGLSGGIDSALTATIAAAALGPERVIGVAMPSIYSSPASQEDAQAVARNLGIARFETRPIIALHEAARQSISAPGAAGPSLTDENVQSRLRGLMLMAMANERGGLVLATGNKSELATGYCTLYGDMCGAVAVLGDVLKSRVYELARWINANHAAFGFDSPPIPERSITRAPSAELRPNQTDQDTLPPYDLLDEIITRRVELEQSGETIEGEMGLDAALIRRVLRMIDAAQFKRDQAALILKVSGRSFGRGRPMPMAMRETAVPTDALSGDGAANGEQPVSSVGAGAARQPARVSAPASGADA
jgi:NAD+ synthase/NAD+ synthase (glutamine-hydrolysing)